MKTRILLVLCAIVLVSLSLSLAQTKDDCTAKSSCCMHGAKASLTSAGKTSQSADAKVIFASDKKSVAKSSAECTMSAKECTMAKTSAKKGECTAAEMAHCDMAKAAKMDCCKGAAKASEAKNMTKKSSQVKVAEGKGTN